MTRPFEPGKDRLRFVVRRHGSKETFEVTLPFVAAKGDVLVIVGEKEHPTCEKCQLPQVLGPYYKAKCGCVTDNHEEDERYFE